ncbi:MAG: DUF2202 domain-containing protein [Actinobacteria bacterium]|nr:DUF2202 domain-containing protein [Actinomycetota bacterium]
MKPRWKLIVFGVLVVVIVATMAGVALAGRGPGGEQPAGATMARTTSVMPLSSEEAAELIYMREEEKLARDVYLVLYEKWEVDEFENIATSESRHMASVKRLLDRYGLADPVGADAPGVFANTDLQAAYDSLVAQGLQSLEDAFEVGVAIEKLDIADLKELIAISTHRDVTRVAENLLRGSERHLAAFKKLLEQ